MNEADLLQKIYEALYPLRFELGVEAFFKSDHAGFSEMRVVFHNEDRPDNTIVVTAAPYVEVETRNLSNAS
jgi:hypothetical protein